MILSTLYNLCKRRHKWCPILIFLGLLFFMWKYINTHKYQVLTSSVEAFSVLKEWSEKYNYPLILIDPTILTLLLSTARRPHASCQYLCAHRAPIFAIQNQFVSNKEVFTNQARGFKFDIKCFEEDSLWLSSRVPTYCTLRLEDSHFHIVFFHERSEAGFLWFSFAVDNHRPQTGALERFNTRPVVLDHIQLNIPVDIPAFLKDFENSRFIECNYTRANLFKRLYYREETTKEAEFRRNGLELIRSAKIVLDSLNVPFWLSSGTCLGWYRQCDLIPYTTDIDLGIFIPQYSPQIVSSLQDAGFRLKYQFGLISDSLDISFVRNDIKMDIFFFYEEDGYTWNGGTQASTGNKYKYIFEPFSLCWTEFHDMKVRIPCESESYIRANYGPNWFEPVTEWDWKRSPPNCKDNGRWSDDMMQEVVQMFD